MSLKAGRRGLHKRLVDAFGNLNGEAPSGDYYTKQQTDDKFETKTNANNTFQQKTLEVPIEMLSGSKLTVEDALQGLNEEKFTYADNGVLGAKNLLQIFNMSYSGINTVVNLDGSITSSGTKADTGGSNFRILEPNKLILPIGKYKLSLSGNTTKILRLALVPSAGDWITKAEVTSGNEVEFEITSNDSDKTISMFFLSVESGDVINWTYYPMIRLSTDPDDTYVPYAMTNREITEELTVQESAVTDIIGGATVGDIGNFLYKQGNIVWLTLRLQGVTTTAWDSTPIGIIPEGFRPRKNLRILNSGSMTAVQPIQINSGNGTILSATALNNETVILTATWISD